MRKLNDLVSSLSKVMNIKEEVILCETNVKESKVLKEGNQIFIILDMNLPFESKEVFIKDSIITEVLDDIDISVDCISEFDSLDGIYALLTEFKGRMMNSLFELMSHTATLKVGDKITLLEDLLDEGKFILPKWGEVEVVKIVNTKDNTKIYVGDEYYSYYYGGGFEVI